MCDSPESWGKVGFGTSLVQALTKPLICFHPQWGAVFIVASWYWWWVQDRTQLVAVSAEAPSIYLNFIWASAKVKCSDPGPISSPQVVSFELYNPPSGEWASLCLCCIAYTGIFSELLCFSLWPSGSCLAKVTFQQLAAKCLCADPSGEVLNPSLGVFRQARIANNGWRLPSLAFKSSLLQVFTAFFTFPFHWGCLGLKFGARTANLWRNSWLPDCQIQDRNSRMPRRTNCTLNWSITGCAVFLWISATSKRTGGSVGWASGCYAGGREFDSGRTITQALKITEEKVLPLYLNPHMIRLSSLLG